MKKIIKPLIQQIRYVRYEIYQTLEKPGNLENIPIKFIIFSGARSGSTLLSNMLNTHPEILCHHEIFNSQKIYYAQNIRDNISINTVEERDRNVELFLAKLWQKNFNSTAVGFKILRNQNPTAASLVIKDKKVRKILLVRRNQIKSYVSMKIAMKTKNWCVSTKNTPQGKESQQVSIKVNVESLHNWIKKHNKYYESIRQQLRNSKQSFLEISYEDLVGPKNELVKSSVLQFIGVSAQPHILQTTLKKQNSENLVDLVSNFGELEEKLRGTELAPLLYS
jgi:LPS sulfotransferase NodH